MEGKTHSLEFSNCARTAMMDIGLSVDFLVKGR